MFWFNIFFVVIVSVFSLYHCDSRSFVGHQGRDYPLPSYNSPTQPPKWSVQYDSSCLCPSYQYGSQPSSYGHFYQPPVYSNPPNSYQPSPVYKPPNDNQSSYLPTMGGLPPPILPPTLYAAPENASTTQSSEMMGTTTGDMNTSFTQMSTSLPAYYPSSYYPSYQPPNYQPPIYQAPTYQTPTYQQGYSNPTQNPYKLLNNNWNQWLKAVAHSPWMNYQQIPGSNLPGVHNSNVWPFPYMHKKPENNQQQVVYIQQPHILPILTLPPTSFDLTSRNPSKIQVTTAANNSNQTTEQNETENVDTTNPELDTERIEDDNDARIDTEENSEREEKKFNIIGDRDSSIHTNTI